MTKCDPNPDADPGPTAFRSVLLTGATGYLGHAIAARLLGAGVEVHVIVRRESDTTRFARLPSDPVVHVHEGGAEALVPIVEAAEPDAILHLAGRYVARHDPTDVERLIASNLTFGTQLLEAASLGGVRSFVNTGSLAQARNGRPAANLYGATRDAFQRVAEFYDATTSITATTLQLYYTYGPGDTRGKLVEQILRACRTGEELALVPPHVCLDLVYVDDVVDAYLQAAALALSNPESVATRTFAVRPPVSVTVGEIVSAAEAVSDARLRVNWSAYSTPRLSVDEPWRGPLLTGWSARVPLVEGLRRSADWTRSAAPARS